MAEPDLFEKALKEDLDRQVIFNEHQDSVEGMSDLLINSYGWAELYSDFDEDELIEAMNVISENFETVETQLQFDIFRQPARTLLNGCSLQFFFDLFGYGSQIDATDILISYLSDVDSGGSQKYQLYAGDSPADIEFFFESIIRQPALIFQGTFLPTYTKGVPSPTTRLNRQRSLNAICVDIDPMPSAGGEHRPITPDVLDQFLAECPDDLTPSYICLTGNGIHLWYIFDSPIQVFSRNSTRVRKLNALARGLYRCVELIIEGSESELDFSCCVLNHGFRAPGSLTKYGDVVRCFCPEDRVYQRSSKNAAELSRIVSGYLGSEFEPSDVLLDSDAIWKSRRQITEEHNAWLEQKTKTPASEAQLEMLFDLERQGLLKKAEVETIDGINSLYASELIRKALARRTDAKLSATTSSYSTWRTKPHSLIAGSTGGVYACILNAITEVSVGRRYNSLHMLAGVAYMMIKPGIPKEDVRDDFMRLLDTPWAKAGIPLTERDIKNALGGYNPNNRQTVNSIITTLGFSPFKPPAKRNGRKQSDHLRLVAEKKIDKSRIKIVEVLKEKPDASMAEVSRITGLSRPTVKKHWEYSKTEAAKLI